MSEKKIGRRTEKGLEYFTEEEYAARFPAPVKKYDELRREKYPLYEIYLDAKVKQASGDPDIRAEGVQQEADYLAECLSVKEQHPKPKGEV